MIVKSWFKFSLWNHWYKPSNIKFNINSEVGIRNILIPNSSNLISSTFGNLYLLNLILFKSNLFISLSHASRAISLGLVLINFKSCSSKAEIGPYNFISIIYPQALLMASEKALAAGFPNKKSAGKYSSFAPQQFDSHVVLLNQFWFNSSSIPDQLKLVINSQQLHINPNIKTFILLS
jgi:hypothetical protein